MDAHGYGTKIEISSPIPLTPSVVEGLLRQIVVEIGERCLEGGARAIGHIKCLLKADQGYAKADVVRLKQGAYAETRLGSPIFGGSLYINSILLGMKDGEVERITLGVIQKVLAHYGISIVGHEVFHKEH